MRGTMQGSTSMRGFSTNNNNKDESGLSFEEQRKQVLERERKVFESLSEKDKQYYQAFRLSLIKSIEENWNSSGTWWSKVKTMTPEEIESLPNEYLRKFGSYIVKTWEMN